MKVKICGLTSAAAVEHAAGAGAASLGFNFYPPSPRALELGAARKLVLAAPAGITKVALVVDLAAADGCSAKSTPSHREKGWASCPEATASISTGA